MFKLAKDISWRPPQRCPKCGVGVLPTGRHEPFAVDADGRVYCRKHGAASDRDYAGLCEAYRQDRALVGVIFTFLWEDGIPFDRSDVEQAFSDLGWND